MTESQRTQERCFLLELPTELRVPIYDEVFRQARQQNRLFEDDSDKRDSIVRLNTGGDYRSPSTSFLELPPILKTCRTIHNEAIAHWYSTTTFLFTQAWQEQSAWFWLDRLPQRYRVLISKVRLISHHTAALLEQEYASKGHLEKKNEAFGVGAVCQGSVEQVIGYFRRPGLELDFGRIEVQWPCLVEGWEWKNLVEIDQLMPRLKVKEMRVKRGGSGRCFVIDEPDKS